MTLSSPPEGGRTGPVFRHFICRVSGLPADSLDALSAPECVRIADRLAEAEAALHDAREAVSERLHAAVQGLGDPAARRTVLQLRRDLYNLRAPKPAVLRSALAALNGERGEVEAFHALLETRARLEGEWGPAYADALRVTRRRFREMLDDEGFQKGLLLSSPALFDAQERYRRAGAAVDARMAKVERGLLRYFSRTCMKATPFGTLCSVVPGVVAPADGGPAALQLRGDPLAKRSVTRLNKALFALLMDALLRRPAFRAGLRVELNPTLEEEADGGFVFLTSLRGKEVFVRLPRTAGVARVAGLVRAGSPVTLGELVRVLAAHPGVEASEQEALSYLDALLAGGFLRFDTGVGEQEVDWDLSFAGSLAGVEDPGAARVGELLAALRALAARYDAARAPERRDVLEAAHAEIARTLAALGVRGRFAQLPFMEDATAAVTAHVADTSAFRLLERRLSECLSLLRTGAYPRGEMAELRHFFERHYPAGTPPVPLLRFYEDFHREHLKPHLARVAGQTAGSGEPYDVLNPFGLAICGELRRAQLRLGETVSDRWEASPDAEEIDLLPGDLAAAFAGIPPLPPEPFSLGIFGEVVPGEGPGAPLRLVAPGRVSIGHGRLFSRFVYLLPDAVGCDLRRAAAAALPARLAEIGGDSGHNANLHPPLLEWEIRYPTVQPGIAEHQVAPTELVVEPSEHDPHALVLRHARSGDRVVPVDLGFTVRESRPPLYQLLCRFMPACEYQHRWPAYPRHVPPELREPSNPDGEPGASAAPDAEAAPDPPWMRVVCRPRITVSGTLVLARRSWRVPAWLLPQIEPWETDEAFFLRVDRWRRAHGIPRQAYVKVWPEFLAGGALGEIVPRQPPAAAADAADGAEAGAARAAPVGRLGAAAKYQRGTLNLRKPQYVDFDSPLLVSLFGRLAGELEAFVAFVEECCPPARDLPRCDGRPYAVEQVFQLQFAPDAPDDED